jgi:hypothetical protein
MQPRPGPYEAARDAARPAALGPQEGVRINSAGALILPRSRPEPSKLMADRAARVAAEFLVDR